MPPYMPLNLNGGDLGIEAVTTSAGYTVNLMPRVFAVLGVTETPQFIGVGLGVSSAFHRPVWNPAS